MLLTGWNVGTKIWWATLPTDWITGSMERTVVSTSLEIAMLACSTSIS